MRQRIFIAINLPEDIKNKLLNYQSKWPDLPVRWVKKENIHITLAFLGYLNNEELLEVLKITKEVAQKNQPFSINLNKICYGPPNQKKPPRMVWVVGEKSEKLGRLQNDFENSFSNSSVESSEEFENRSYAPHITLGRIKQWEFRAIEPEERPIVDEEISLNFAVNSIEAMESQLKRDGAEYSILESFPLAKI